MPDKTPDKIDKTFEKTADFLSQIPEWEKEYKESDKVDIEFEKKDWKDAPADFAEHDLKIFGYAVMEDWEAPYMKDLAEIATMKGGRVLELGYGMGISAKYIQEYPIDEHIIIEANTDVANKAREFAAQASHKTTVLEGLWEDVIDQIPDGSLDGILFDTYPLTEEEVYQNHFNFFDYAFKKLKLGGIFTYYSDEPVAFGKVHMRKLQEAGFSKEKITSRICEVHPPEDCEYWKTNTIMSPIVEK